MGKVLICLCKFVDIPEILDAFNLNKVISFQLDKVYEKGIVPLPDWVAVSRSLSDRPQIEHCH
jgi:hypothetical protein